MGQRYSRYRRQDVDAYDEFGLDGFEEGFDSRIIIVVALATHGHLEPVLPQDLLIIV